MANAQSTWVYDVITNDHKSIINATASMGMVDDQVGMSGPPIISMDLNDNGISDYVTAHHAADYTYVFFDQIDFTEEIYYPHEGPNLIISGAFKLGSSFTSGDFNGDGIDDLLIGAKAQGGDGEAFVIFGSASIPTSGTYNISDIMDVRLSFVGFSGNSDLFGDQVCAADLNNDGFDEIIVGATVAWYEADGSGRGSVYVVYGNSTLPSIIQARTESDIIIEGSYLFDHIGKYLISGDFNNDNYEDLVFTSAYWPGAGAGGQRGKAWVLFGSSSLQNYYNVGESYPEITGFAGQYQGDEMAYAGMGDINGDDIDDLILTCGKYPDQYNTGITYINYGPIPMGNDYSVDDYPNQTKIIPSVSSLFTDAKLGQGIATYDINNDGYDDLLLGGPGYSRWPLITGSRTTEGVAFIIMGGANLPDEMNPTEDAIFKFLANNQNNYPDYSISFGRAVNFIKMNNNKIYTAIADIERSKIYLFEPKVDDVISFTDINASLEGVENGSVAWGDYDNDSDLDILITGSGTAGSVSKIYRNENNGVFTDINASLESVENGSVAWGDYDNDSDIDILITGSGTAGSVSKIYRNENNGVFTDINASLEGVENSSVAWGDYDNDSDLDLIITGKVSYNNYVSIIYQNGGNGVFTEINASLVGVQNGSVAWGDYDNDNDLDILLSGESSSYPYKVSVIYRNDGNNSFEDIGANLRGMDYGSVDWGDYDNDGDLDALISGYGRNPFREWTKLYRNDGNDSFTDIYYNEWLDIRESGPILFNIKNGTAKFGDCNNDGWLDILVTGGAGYFPYSYNYNTYVHINNGSGKYHWIENLPVDQAKNSIAKWGDYDNDGDPDFILIGETESGNIVKIYKNNFISVDLSTDNENETISSNYLLHQNYPNPFNPVTTLHYDLPKNAMVNIAIYDMLGRQVKTLINDQQTAGFKSVQWNATNNAGQPVSAGLYLYTIEAGKFRQTKKMVLLK